MSIDEKKKLIDLLSNTRSVTRAAIEGADLEMGVYQDSDWRVIDILGHVATWERESAKSLDAFREGKEYSIPDFEEHDFNQKAVIAQRVMTTQQIFDEWEQAHEDIKRAIQELPLDKFTGDMLYPWGDDRGSVADLVEFMSDHDIEHRDEIAKASKKE